MKDRMSLSDKLIKPNSLKKVRDASLQNFSLFSHTYQSVATK